ncbi:MAG: SCO family protein [Gammaproteobacteria bacterium]|nr:SCO family protein [Gammaproteobacteria bacterium]
MSCKSLRVRSWLAVGLLALLAASGAASAGYSRDGDFTLTGPDGPLSLSDLKGKVVLIFFGYTSCPDVCPLSLARIHSSFSEMDPKELDRVRALFITLDPERDTLDRLQKYTGYFHPNIIGLRQDEEVIRSVADQFGVKFSKTMRPESALGYTISHSTEIFLLDSSGQIVEAIPHNSKPTYLRARIRDLLNASD